MRKFKIKNWTLAFIAFIFFCFLLSLGIWQLQRAAQKKELLNTFHERTKAHPLTNIGLLNDQKDLRFYRASLTGTFDQAHIFLLDNKIFHGQVGYEVYVPFRLFASPQAILVDLGFLPVQSREDLPIIKKIAGNSVSGLLNSPPNYFAFGNMIDKNSKDSLRRIEYIDLKKLEKILFYPLSPYVLSLAPNDPLAYPIEWQIVTMGPERHLGYAFQWFALAFTLLILFVALNLKRH